MKSKRLLELMKRVTQLQRFTVQELAEEFGVSYRTMWRYLQELSELGVPLYSEPGAAGGYRVLREARAKTTPAGTAPTGSGPGANGPGGNGQADGPDGNGPADSGPGGNGSVAPKAEEPVMVDIRPFHVVGFSFTSPLSARAEAGVLVPRLWMRLLSRVDEIRNVVDPTVRLGLSRVHDTFFHYYVGLQVSQVEELPADMVSLYVPAHRYARFRHQGSMERERIDATYNSAYAWIEAHRLKRNREAFWIERYDQRYDPGSPSNLFEIDLPVLPA
jgi:predicted transcriptional regulator YdeE/biotin operon repressor